jgi:hypothetical protein
MFTSMFAQTTLPQMSNEMQQCTQNCLKCHSTCLSTLMLFCLPQGGQHAEANHVSLMLDCADVCQTCANFMLRGSMLHARTCGVCAEVCEMCARDCEQFAEDAHMQACAQICRRCAESCRQMSMSTSAA